MSALFDGREIWSEGKLEYPPLTKEQQAKWEKIQADCREVADFSIQFAKDEETRWQKTREEFHKGL